MEHGLKCDRVNSSKYEICEPFYHVCFSRSTPNFVETKQNFGRGGKNTAKKPIRIAEKYYTLGGGFKDCLFSPLLGATTQFDQYVSN